MQLSVVIPARSGSKRLVDKNIRPLAGKPLMFHTIAACVGHDAIANVIVSTDSEDYIRLIEAEFGGTVRCVLRPAATASDTAKVTDELRRLLDAEKDLFPSEWFGVCLPTAPLRGWAVMERALQQWQKTKTALFSAMAYDFPTQFAFRITKDGDWDPVLGKDSPMVTGNTRSQDIEVLYRPNGALYIQQARTFLQSGVFYTDAKPFLMSSEESVDVDTEFEFMVAEHLLKARK